MRSQCAAIIAALTLTLNLSQVQAATPENFNLRNAQDLVDLCAIADADPMAEAGRSFCFGYLTGAYHYDQALYANAKDRASRVCVPEPRPTRAEGAAQWVAWAQSHPQFMNDPAIDVLYRFAIATWPCPTPAGKPR